jgi:hypothetical protein
MSAVNKVSELQAYLLKTKQQLAKNAGFFELFYETDFKKLGPGTASAMILSQIFTDCYTIMETLFLRVSQFFENSLSASEWHKELLEKMRLEVPGIRKAVITDKTFEVCAELLRFRHFRRYYFELEYDWDRIEMVEKKYRQIQTLLPIDLDTFYAFLQEIKEA